MLRVLVHISTVFPRISYYDDWLPPVMLFYVKISLRHNILSLFVQRFQFRAEYNEENYKDISSPSKGGNQWGRGNTSTAFSFFLCISLSSSSFYHWSIEPHISSAMLCYTSSCQSCFHFSVAYLNSFLLHGRLPLSSPLGRSDILV